jgi:hypothetical protein
MLCESCRVDLACQAMEWMEGCSLRPMRSCHSVLIHALVLWGRVAQAHNRMLSTLAVGEVPTVGTLNAVLTGLCQVFVATPCLSPLPSLLSPAPLLIIFVSCYAVLLCCAVLHLMLHGVVVLLRAA